MSLLLLCLLAIPHFVFAEDTPPLEPPYTRRTGSLEAQPIEKPDSISDEGEYYYSTSSQPDAVYYDLTHLPPIKGAVYLRVSRTNAFDLAGEGGATYKQVYGDDPGIGFVFDYEWQLFHLLGKWTVKASTGLTVGNGKGQFASPLNAGVQPREKFLLLLSPHTLLLNYKLRFSDTQWFIPYVEGGPGYYTYLERRDDGDKTGFGGAPILAAAGGLLISMSLLDRNSAGLLYDDYGINHMWFDLQFRRIEGLDKSTDFSSNMISTGFGFAF